MDGTLLTITAQVEKSRGIYQCGFPLTIISARELQELMG